MRAEAWASWAAWATVIVAAVAAYLALRQVYEAKATRESAKQPHVIAFLDMNQKNWQWFDLVIKNFGPTTAYNIKVKLPSLKVVPYTTNQGVDVSELYVPTDITTLAPGQEWRTIWDSAIDREEHKPELVSQYVGRLEYSERVDSNSKRHTVQISLDTKMFRNSMRFSDEQPSNPIVGILSQIAATLSQYQNEHEGIWVYPLSADEQRRHLQEQEATRREKQQELNDLVDRALGKRTKLKFGPDDGRDAAITDGETTTVVEFKNHTDTKDGTK
ncbi:hypothetical protein [Mycobacterium triplex]|uniref:Uncharacterized protein n=1 Tax=Mycobacterium triplex TaxID=47839 RepID=A0A024K0T6_9MYCO|nr:hypothetical protein [Mycobacterium triplex]CDO89536.1 hypothetical protein BN973_03913 [Mycobacterium triplex]